MKKVTVVVPYYNVEDYIAECLDSLIAQTYSNIEILCVNDCSSDGSDDIVVNYAGRDDRIKIVRHERNLGLGGARNTGVAHANGDYLCFVDSDDYVSDKFVELLYEAVTRDGSDVAVCNYWKDEDGEVSVLLKAYDNEVLEVESCKDNVLDIVNKFNPACTNKIYRRDLLVEKNLLQPEHRYFEGVVFWLQTVYYSRKISTVSDRLYYYRRRPGSIMKSHSHKHIDDRFEFIMQLDIFIKDEVMSTPGIDAYRIENGSLYYLLEHLHYGKVLIDEANLEDRSDVEEYYDAQVINFSTACNWPGLTATLECFRELKKLRVEKWSKKVDENN